MDEHADQSGPAVAEEPELRLPTPEEAEQAEVHLRRYMAAKAQGNKQMAESALDAAVAAAPGAADIMLAQMRDLVERAQYRKALELGKKAVALHPKNAPLESLYGEMVLRTSEAASRAMTQSDLEVMASGKVAPWLSFFIPGLGQIVTQQYVLGYSFLGVWLLVLLWLYSIPEGVPGLTRLFGGRTDVEFNPAVMAPLFVVSVCWIASIAMAVSAGKAVSRREIPHPIPPVDKEF